ncbi:MAG: RDD family protein [Verrucomicrobiota bacterium JB025]|nr:RDD family protein [Verrucomicrobiota bacterium JB025]
MDIWIIEDGAKTGPFNDYEIRSRIEDGKLPADTMAWHEGLDAWSPLAEIPIFKSEFDKPFQAPHPESPAEPTPQPETGPLAQEITTPAEAATPTPPPINAKAPIRRFWARWMDLYLFGAFWWLTMWAVGRDIEATLNNAWVMLLLYAPWFLGEIYFIHRFGTTPGKWLLGIRVTNDDGSLLDLTESTRRTMRVYFLGIGFGISIVSVICQALSLFTVHRIGKPIWDHAGGHRVSTSPLNPLRLVVFVIVFFCSLQLQGLVLAPYTMKQLTERYPAAKEFFEKHPPPQLPPRH